MGGGGGGGGAGGAAEARTACQNTKMQLSSHCRACRIINILKYINKFLSTNPTSVIWTSLVSEF